MQKTERVDEFVSLYTRYSVGVRRYIRPLVPRQSDADDVFQNVGRLLWAKFDQYENGTNFLAWAIGVARLEVLQYRRLRARLPASISDSVFDVIAAELMDPPPQEEMRLEFLNECLRNLSETDRNLINARYRKGKDTKSVALEVNRSVDAVYRSLRRIHKTLFACIQRRIVAEGGA